MVHCWPLWPAACYCCELCVNSFFSPNQTTTVNRGAHKGFDCNGNALNWALVPLKSFPNLSMCISSCSDKTYRQLYSIFIHLKYLKSSVLDQARKKGELHTVNHHSPKNATVTAYQRKQTRPLSCSPSLITFTHSKYSVRFKTTIVWLRSVLYV